MKKHGIALVVLLAVAGLLPGCTALHTGYMASSTSLSSANFHYVVDAKTKSPTITGTASATYIFGFGGMMTEGLVNEAKQDMLTKHPLNPGEALVNLTVNFKNTFIFGFVYMQTTCYITAEVVSFNDTGKIGQLSPGIPGILLGNTENR